MPAWLDISIFGLTMFIMLVGLVGLVVPIFPGVVVIWLAALGYGIVTDFGTIGVVVFIFITLSMLAGVLIDNVLMGAKARQGGASWWSIGAALLAGVLGMALWPPIGGLIAAPIGLVLVEYLRSRDLPQAVQATKGLALGCGWAFVIRFGVGVLMIVLWLIWALT